jgi:fumarylpyruvate hydrolase
MSIVYLDGAEIPVGTIYCIGKNYDAHAKEMREKLGDKTATEKSAEPIVFSKPASSLIQSGKTIVFPTVYGRSLSSEMHHEVELVALIGIDATNVQIDGAEKHVAGFGIGLDMTLRDKQQEAKKNGTPWLVSKGFRTGAVVSSFISASGKSASNFEIMLSKNGAKVQHGFVREMLFSLDEIVSYLSHVFGLRKGDLIYTGTPEGVGAVAAGDTLDAILFDLSTHDKRTTSATLTATVA